MLIRQETESDYDKVYQVVKKAFSRAQHSDGNEQDLVVALRKSDAFLPELSLVAEVDGDVVGHILFTKNRIGSHTGLSLAPLSVSPEFQRQGIGMALIKEGHRIAKELGYAYSVVLGSERYYPKAGYLPASQFGIKAPFDVPDHNFMAICLQDVCPPVCGVVAYPKEFGI